MLTNEDKLSIFNFLKEIMPEEEIEKYFEIKKGILLVKKKPTYRELHLPNGEIWYGYQVCSIPDTPEVIERNQLEEK